jgi:hypothetical protein
MLAPNSKWNEILSVFETARRRARALEERENREANYGVLLLLLLVSLIGFAILVLRKMS